MRADVMSRQSRHTRFVEAAWPIQRNSKSEEAHVTICERTDKVDMSSVEVESQRIPLTGSIFPKVHP